MSASETSMFAAGQAVVRMKFVVKGTESFGL
jgi:hypothetical protein